MIKIQLAYKGDSSPMFSPKSSPSSKYDSDLCLADTGQVLSDQFLSDSTSSYLVQIYSPGNRSGFLWYLIIEYYFLAMSKDTLRIIFDIISKFSDSPRNALFQRSFTGPAPAQHRHLFVLEGIISPIFTLGTHPF